MSRQRSARSAALGLTVRRIPTTTPSRSAGPLRRRLVVGILVLASLVLISLSFRSGDDGPLSGVQSAGATALRPFAVGFERVAQPFRDAYAWADSLLTARCDAEELRTEVRDLRQRAIQSEFALQENAYLRELLDYIDGPRFPADFDPVAAEVIGRPAGAFTQAIVIAAGSDRGVASNDPVVTPDGLVGLVTRVSPGTARIQLLTDEEAAASAIDLRTGATGIVRHARGTRETLVLDRVRKQDVVRRGHEIVTAGWRAGGVELALPEGHPDRKGHERRPDGYRPLPAGAGRSRTSTSARSTPSSSSCPRRARDDRCAPRFGRSPSSSSQRCCRSSSSPRSSSQAGPPTFSSSSWSPSVCSAARFPERCWLRGRPRRRPRHPRDARGQLARPDARRLLGRPLRRDDRSWPALRSRSSPSERSRCSPGRSATCSTTSSTRRSSPRHALVTALAPAFVLNLLLALPVHRLVRALVGEELRAEPSADVEVVV